jgi:hypothetical protein
MGEEGGAERAGSRGGPASPPPAEGVSVEIEVDGECWQVTEVGRTRAGHPGDARAPLLFLAFARSEAPEAQVREALVPGTELPRLSHDQLQEAFQRSRPWSPPPPSKQDSSKGRRDRRPGR